MIASPPRVASYVAGEWLRDGEAASDINPARPTETVAQVTMAGADAAGQAVAAARHAFAAWRDTPAPARGEILHRAAELILQRLEPVARELTSEEGKTLAEATGELRRAAGVLRYYAAQTLEPDGETYPSASARTFLYARREPIGTVLAITPWNFPAAIPAWKIAPALAYGNTVVWKPADLVPLTSLRLLEAFVDAGLPPGVLNLVIGRGSVVGDALVEHPDVSAISFTGSNQVGSSIRLRAAARGTKLQLEMGGKNPAVVLADADLDLAAEHVARGSFLSAGQKCTATSRVIVDERVVESFTERLCRLTATWKLGDPMEPDTRIGPVVSQPALDSVLGYIRTGSAEGRIVLGGERAASLGDGYFVEPTVITGLSETSPVVNEEIFGPVAAVLPARDAADALRLANQTTYGLSASVFTRDLGRALQFASGLDVGVVKINQESAGLELHVPFGGNKQSSSGSREQGKVARDFFTQWKTVYVDAEAEPTT